MNDTIRLGRIAGIRVGLNWSWILVFALFVWSLSAVVFPAQDPGLATSTYVWMGVGAALLFFVSLFLHELGHALVARREGMEIDGITLWLFGGVARFKGMFPSAGAEFRIAIAGPVVSAVLGGGFVALAAVTHFSKPLDGVAAWLGYINLLLLAFNLIPALPLDGGRVFRSLLWRARGDFDRATVVAADVGRGFSWIMIGAGIVLLVANGTFAGLWLAFLGWFLLGAAGAEARLAAIRSALAGVTVGDLMVRDPITTPPDESLASFMSRTGAGERHTAYPVEDGGRAVGMLLTGSVLAVPRHEWTEERVRGSMLQPDEVPVLSAQTAAADALLELSASRAHGGLVVDGGRLVGLLSMGDLARAIGPGPLRRGAAWRSRAGRRNRGGGPRSSSPSGSPPAA